MKIKYGQLIFFNFLQGFYVELVVHYELRKCCKNQVFSGVYRSQSSGHCDIGALFAGHVYIQELQMLLKFVIVDQC